MATCRPTPVQGRSTVGLHPLPPPGSQCQHLNDSKASRRSENGAALRRPRRTSGQIVGIGFDGVYSVKRKHVGCMVCGGASFSCRLQAADCNRLYRLSKVLQSLDYRLYAALVGSPMAVATIIQGSHCTAFCMQTSSMQSKPAGKLLLVNSDDDVYRTRLPLVFFLVRCKLAESNAGNERCKPKRLNFTEATKLTQTNTTKRPKNSSTLPCCLQITKLCDYQVASTY